MCGIVGVIYPNGRPVDQRELISARDTLVHRGPDAYGLYVDKNIGLGHRRLSIVDVAGGHQPLSNEDGSIWITFNGEIYNFRALRESLIDRGHTFKTNSDTETIVHLYEERGLNCLDDLDGMFAFAIWDKNRNRLFAARDRLGEKPFYYYHSPEIFAFASEIKALFEFRGVVKEVNLTGLEEYFTFKYLAGERTLFQDILTLPPGHFLVYEDNEKSIKKYWDLQNGPMLSDGGNISDLVSAFDDLFLKSVQERLMSEVPLGTFNSGGIDSSLITAITSGKVNSRVNSFSVGFEDPAYDESIYANLVSEKYNTVHHSLCVTNEMFSDNLPKAIWLNDEPLNHANSVSIFLLSQLTKKYVTVVLTGEGADELFGGYPRYFILKYYAKLLKAPKPLRVAIQQALSLVGGRKAEKIRDVVGLSFDEALMYNSVYARPNSASSFLRNDLTTGHFEQRINYLKEMPFSDDLQRIFHYEVKTYLVSILNRADKMTMGASVEGRVPFLDHRCVEFCFKIPLEYRLHKHETKYVLKKYSQRYLPQSIIHRKKSGFGTPVSKWLTDRKGLGRYLDLLRDVDSKDQNLFNQHSINRMVSEHLRGECDYGETLWELINFKLWRSMFWSA